MPRIELDREARDFIVTMQPKHARQVLLAIISLSKEPRPQDCRPIKGSRRELFRIDVGEYRIIYFVAEDAVWIPLIGKRNDDEVYKQLKRKGH